MHFQIDELDDQVYLVSFDTPEQKVNTLSQAVQQELEELLDEWEQKLDYRGLLFRSGKPGQFIAGADLKELSALADLSAEEVTTLLSRGHAIFSRLSKLPFPTIALIDGNCMGGGTELVLSLDERIASDSPKTKIALPEVNIGILPGWGGTQRMPRLVGIDEAIKIITSGKPIDGQHAAETGFAFDCVPVEQLVETGQRHVEYLQQSEAWQIRRKELAGSMQLSADELQFASAIAQSQVQAKTGGHYPAPLAALKAITEGVNQSLDAGLALEQQVALEVVGSRTSANLIGVFFMNNQVERDPGFIDPKLEGGTVERVGVLGAGLMGSGIAAAHARSGYHVTMVDMKTEYLEQGLQRACDVVNSRIKIGRASQHDLTEMLSRINTSVSQNAFAECDVVVEAVTENEELKTKIYHQLAEVLPDDAILASNTSTISITRMAAAAPNPERFAGLHFFNPVDRMQLVEVIQGEKTSDETLATLIAQAKSIRKTPIVVKDCPGFLVNRVLLPYMNEAIILLTEGAEMDKIDKAATQFGMPMGPIALHDLVGLDTAYYAGQVLANAFAERAVQSDLLKDLVEAGRLGKKTGAGYRQFVGKKGRPTADPEFAPFLEKHRTAENEYDSSQITDRLFLPMLFEAVRALEEEIVASPAHVDLGLMLATGFPSFRGGILRWCDNEGAETFIHKSEQYQDCGARFQPPALLQEQAKTGQTFYS